MGLIDKIQNKGNQPVVADSSNLIELNKRETEFLLQTMELRRHKDHPGPAAARKY